MEDTGGSSAGEASGSPPAGSEYWELVGPALPRVEEWLRGRKGVAVMVPCGCSRGELLRRWLRPVEGGAREQLFSRVLAYKGFRGKAGGLEEVVEYESLEELAGELEAGLGGRTLVVPGSSWEALALKSVLKRRAPSLEVELLYLPELYEGLAERFSEDVRKLARVEHPSLRDAYGCRAQGYSLTLLRAWRGEELEELARAKEAILKLSPGRLGLVDYLVEAARRTAVALAVAPLGAAVALAVEQLVSAFASLGLHHAVSTLLGGVGGVSAEQVGSFASRIVEEWSRRKVRDEVALGLARLASAARAAAPHLDREELETVVDQVALEWGMDTHTFKQFVKNLARMARGELVTREELRRELERLEGVELEERLSQLIRERLERIEDELGKVKQDVEALKVGVKLFYLHELEEGQLYANFRVEGGKPVVVSQEERGRVEAELVTTGSFGKLAEDVLARLRRLGESSHPSEPRGPEGGFIVLEGPKGVGKSTLAAYTAWQALLRGLADAVIQVTKLDRGEALSLENLVRFLGKRFLVLYDPSPLHAYYKPGAFAEEAQEAVAAAEETLWELLELAEGGSGVLVLAVLPSDLYRGLSRKLREELEQFALHVNLRDPLFLGEVVRVYSGCAGGFEELAGRIAEFKSGYTLVAKYAGLLLRSRKCSVEDVAKALEEAKKRPKLFLAHYLWSVVLRENRGNLAKRVAVPLLLHAAFGPVPEGLTYLMQLVQTKQGWSFIKPRELAVESYSDVDLEPVARWLSVLHEDLVEEVLAELCGFRGEKARRQYADQLPELVGEQGVLDWALNRVVRKAGGRGINPRVALLEFTGRRLGALLQAHIPGCWRRLALMAGAALAGYSFEWLAERAASSDFEGLQEAAGGHEIDSFLLVGGELPLLSRFLLSGYLDLLVSSTAEAGVEGVRGDIEALRERLHQGAGVAESVYGLGLASLASVAAKRKLVDGEEKLVDEEVAGKALRIAALAVDSVFSMPHVILVVYLLRNLGLLAPNEYASLLSSAADVAKVNEEAAGRIHEEARRLLLRAGRLDGWAKALLAEGLAATLPAGGGGLGLVCELLEELEGPLRLLTYAAVYSELAWRLGRGCGDEDLEVVIPRLIEELESLREEEVGADEQLGKYLEELGAPPEKESIQRLIEERTASLYRALGVLKVSRGEFGEAKQAFEKSADTLRKLLQEEPGNLSLWVNYQLARSRALIVGVLLAGSLQEALGPEGAGGFEEVWREVGKRWAPTHFYRLLRAGTLLRYILYLALEGRGGDARRLLEEDEELLRWYADTSRDVYAPPVVAVRLAFSLLLGFSKPSSSEVFEAVESLVDPVFKPALKLAYGLVEGKLGVCLGMCYEEARGVEALMLPCIDACAAVAGKEVFTKALRKKVAGLVGRELAGGLGAGSLVEVLAPRDSRARLVFLLKALADGRVEVARAHALLASKVLGNEQPGPLFQELAEALEGAGVEELVEREDVKLALAKLLYFHLA